MKAKRLLASALALSMAFGAMSALAVTANAAETTATITAYNSNGDQVGTYTNGELSTAISTAGNGGTVEIGEGVVALSQNVQAQLTDITIKGAGSDKTTIKAESGSIQNFIDSLKEDSADWEYYSLLEIGLNSANYIKATLEGLTIDGAGISGYTGRNWGLLDFRKPINFVPLRLNGSNKASNTPADITLNDIEIKRSSGELEKGCIQIGDNDIYHANVTATDLYVDSNMGESNYADIDICNGSSLTVNDGGFNGIIASSDNNDSITIPEKSGYYKATVLNTYTFYTTIPYLLNCYENNTDRIAEYVELINKLEDNDKTILEKMANDLEDTALQLYGMNCNEQKELAQEFVDAINAIESMEGVTVTVNTASLEEKLQQADWHTWGEADESGVETCSVCGETRTVETPNETTTELIDAATGTGDKADTTATGFVTTIPSGTEVTSIQWEVTSPANDNTTKKTQVFDDLNLSNIDSELKLGLIINGLNDATATATAIINPAEVAK